MNVRLRKKVNKTKNSITERGNELVNVWNIINKNLEKMNEVYGKMAKSIQDITINAIMIKEDHNSYNIKSNQIINTTKSNLKSTISRLEITKNNTDSIKRTLNLDDSESKYPTSYKLAN